MSAEERQLGVRDRIDVGANQLSLCRAQPQVAAAEGNDPRLRRGAAGDRHAVRPEPGAEDRRRRGGDPARVADRYPVSARLGPRHPRIEVDAPSGCGDVLGEGLRDPDEVDHPGGGRVKRRDSARVGLDLRHLAGSEPAQARHSVGLPAPLELVEAPDLALVDGDDQLAGAPVRYLALRAERIEGARALDAQPRLQGPRLVVDPGVDHPARAAGLVPTQPRLRLEDDDPRVGVPDDQLPGDGRPQDPPADDRQVALGWGLERSASPWRERGYFFNCPGAPLLP